MGPTTLFFIFASIVCTVVYSLPERACAPPHDKYPFCDVTLPRSERVNDLIQRLTLDEKPYLLVARESPKGNISRLGLPAFDWGGNCIHGVQSRCTENGVCATSYPNPNALGSTYNRSVWKGMGNTIGVELRAFYLLGVGEDHDSNLPAIGLDCWSPNINIVRDPRWGRNLETPGESPYLNGQFGVEVTLGLQNGTYDDRYMQAVVTLKHFDANSLEGSWGNDGKITRHTVDANISMYDLFETYLPAFRDSVVYGKAAGVMCSYNAVNGVPACASKFLIQDVLRGLWNFDGYVTSDSGAVKDIYESHHYTSNWNDTIKVALEAGCDMESASWPKDHPWATGGPYIDYIPGIVRSGLINESTLDDALRHTLDLRFRLGLFDPVEFQPYWTAISEKDIRSDDHQARAVDATEQSFVLLRNEKNTLPFQAGKRVLVTGPHADDRGAILGNYIGEICPDGTFNCVTSPFEAIQAMNNKSNGTTILEPGCQSVTSTNTSEFQATLDAAKKSDMIVFVGGLDTTVERESMDRHNVGLPGVQGDLLKELVELKIPLVVVLYHGGIVTFDSDLLSKIPALISAGYPGFYGADCMAKMLFDEDDRLAVNRFGKSTVTWYSDAGWKDAKFDMLDFDMKTSPGRTYRYYTGEPEFPFAFGLSYAETSTKIVSHQNDGNGVSVTIEITNHDKNRTTDEIVTLFATAQSGVIDSSEPASQVQTSLVAFERVGPIAPSSSNTTVTLRVDPDVIALTDTDGHSKVYTGKYNIFLSVSSNDDDDDNSVVVQCDKGSCSVA